MLERGEEWFMLLLLVILLTITVSYLTEEWFILCVVGNIINHYFFIFDSGVLHIGVAVILFPINV